MTEEPKNTIKRLVEWFDDALGAADLELRTKDEYKRDNWKTETPRYLYDQLVKHANRMGDQIYRLDDVNIVELAVKVTNYSLMIATRVAQIKREAEKK